MNLGGGSVRQALVRAFIVIEHKVVLQPSFQLKNSLVIVQVHALERGRPAGDAGEGALDRHAPAALQPFLRIFVRHTDGYAVVVPGQQVGGFEPSVERGAGELHF